MPKIFTFFHEITSGGAIARLGPDEKVAAQSNSVASIGALVSIFVYSAALAFLALGKLAILSVSMVPAYGLVIFLNYRGHHSLSKVLNIVSGNLFLFFTVSALPRETDADWTFLLSLLVIKQIFANDTSNVRRYVPLIAAFPLSFFFLQDFLPRAEISMSPEAVLVIRYIIRVVIWGFIYAQLKTWSSNFRSVRKEAEEARTFLSTVLDNAPVAIFCKDAENEFRFSVWNKQAERLMGVRSKDAIGKNDYDFFQQKESDFFREKDQEALASGITNVVPEEVLTRADGSKRYLRTSKVPIHGRFIMGVSEDITERREVLNQLKEQNLRLQALFESMAEGFVLRDATGKVIQFNQAALTILGMTENQLLGRDSLDPRWSSFREDGSSFPGTEHPSMVTLATGKAQHNVLMGVRHPSGEARWILINASPIFIESNERPTYAIATFNDVTEQRRLSEEREESRSRLKIAMEAVRFGTWDWNFATDTLIWDDSMFEIFGVKKGEFEVSYSSFEKLLAAEDTKRIADELQATFAKRGDFSSQFRIISKSGEVREIRAAAKVFYDPKGTVLRMVGANWDVTESQRKDQELKKAFREIDNFFTLSIDLLSIWGVDGCLKRMNASFPKVLGHSPEELMDGPFLQFVHPDDRAATQRELETLLTRGESRIFENRCRCKDGSYRLFSWMMALSPDEGLLYSVARDVTEEKEHALRILHSSKMSSLGEMAAGIAHEINNPLAIIRGKSEQISLAVVRGKFTPLSVARHAGNIVETVDRIAKIIKGLRAFAHDGSHEPFESVFVKDILDDTLAFCVNRFASQEVALRVEPIPDNLVLECRSSQISQVLLNLLNNAFDAVTKLDEKWVKIEIFHDAQTVTIAVTDSGLGIPKEIADRIVQPFFTTKEVGKGMGLGLSISSGIVKSHRGTFEIDKNGVNTRFKIRLPKFQETSAKAA